MNNKFVPDNKRLAQNTLILYVRMAFLMTISLYTSRVILSSLGVEDFGIYNVVGGFVGMLSILTNSLSVSISRFITFYIGKDDRALLHKIFCTSVNVQVILSVVVLALGELAGYYFLRYKMNMPVARYDAAVWTLHCCLLSFVIGLLNVPYNSCIIAHERMKAFAYVSIVEAVCKLIVAYLISVSVMDRLKFYAVLMLVVALVVRLIYGIYCHMNFNECKYNFIFDKASFRQMLNIAGWNVIGQTSYVLNTQGVNLLMNFFFGVVVNAARGIATQVEMAVMQFVNNFTTSLNPQITKSYASGNINKMIELVYGGAKFSCFMLLYFLVPLFVEADTVLTLWLVEVPDHTVVFLRLTLMATLVNLSVNTLFMAVVATGSMKNYSIWVNVIGILVIPVSWLLFNHVENCPPEMVYYVFICIYVVLIFVKTKVLSSQLPLKLCVYLEKVICPIILIGVVSTVVSCMAQKAFGACVLRLPCIVLLNTMVLSLLIWFFGLEAKEKDALKRFVNKKFLALKKN